MSGAIAKYRVLRLFVGPVAAYRLTFARGESNA